MPRDPYLAVPGPDGQLVQRIDKIKRDVDMLKATTTTTLPQNAIAAIDDPLEGELVIDPTSDRLKWYSNGAWHDCICEVAELAVFGPAIYSVDVYDANPTYGDLWTISIATAPGVYEYPIPVGEAGDNHHRTRPVWNRTFDKFAFTKIDKSYFGSVGPYYAELQVANRDGSNIVTIAQKLVAGTEDFQHFDFYTFSHDGTRIAYQVWASSLGTMHVANVDGSGTPIEIGVGYPFQHPIWSLDDEYVYFQGIGDDGYGVYRRKSDGSSPAEIVYANGDIDAFDMNQQGTEFVAGCYGTPVNGLVIFDLEGNVLDSLATTAMPWTGGDHPVGCYWTPDGEWILIGGQPDSTGDTFPTDDVMALKRSDLSTYTRFGFGPNSLSGDASTNPAYAGNSFVGSYTCAKINDALHIVIQLVNYSDALPFGSSSGFAAYPFDNPTAGFWLDDDLLDDIPGVTGGRYYVTGLPHMTNPLIGSFDQ